MDETKKNQLILIFIIIILLIVVMVFAIIHAQTSKQTKEERVTYKVEQLYSSDYDLFYLDSKYYFGSYNNKLNVVIDNTGKEIYKSAIEIEYNNIYYGNNSNYYIVNYNNNTLTIYEFNGTKIEEYTKVENISYPKMIIYKEEDKEILLGYASYEDNILTLYNLENKHTATLENISIVADTYLNDIYYLNNPEYLVASNKDSMMGIIDLNGNKIIDYKYKNILTTSDNTFIVQNKKEKYGILDSNNETLLKINSKAIYYNNQKYLVINSNNKMALYNQKLTKIIDYKLQYDSLIPYDLHSTENSLYMSNFNNYIVIANNYLESENGTEFEYHNLYIIDENNDYKTITQKSFLITSSYLLTYNDNKIEIYNRNLESLGTVEVSNLNSLISFTKINNETYSLIYQDTDNQEITNYYNENLEPTECEEGTLIYQNNEFYGYLKDNTFILKYNNKELYTIKGDKINIIDNYLIVDNEIYLIEV